MRVTKSIEWDMGHRVTNHHSHCRNIHGHRYKALVSLEGDLIDSEGDSNEGMVIDFGDVKKIAQKHIHNVLDHGCMVWEQDTILSNFFKTYSDQKHLLVPFVPTSENIAGWIFTQLDSQFKDVYGTGLRLYSIILYETPTSFATCYRTDAEKFLKNYES